MISKRQVEKFSDLYSECFNEKLSEAELTKKAEDLITLFKAVYGDPLYDNNER